MSILFSWKLAYINIIKFVEGHEIRLNDYQSEKINVSRASFESLDRMIDDDSGN